MSKSLKLEDVIPGMVLAEPVLNSYNQTLLSAGMTLTEEKIKILRTWNIRTLYIKSDENDKKFEISSEILAICTDKLEKRMIWQPRNEIERDLFNSALQILATEYYKKS
jgi:hypothetical protein